MEKKNVPALRFKGFVGDWEQRKVKEVAPLQRGFDLPTVDMKKGGYPVVMSNGIGGYHSEYKVKGPGVVTGRSGTIGNLHYIEGNYWPHNTTLWVTNFNGNASKYVYYLYQRLDLSRFGSGSGVPTLNRNDVHDALTMIPSIEEQKAISDYLETLDRLITLHQRKHKQLQAIKKAMLENMFPKNGESVPEIRFKGFTDDWEQRKLGELSEKTYGGGTPSTTNAEYWYGNIPWLQSSDITDGKLFDVIPKKYISQLGLNSSAAQLVPENSIAIITRVGVGKLAFLPFSYTTSQDFLSMSQLKTEPYFTVYACYKKLQSEINSVQGTSIKGITKNELLAKEISIPLYAEQTKIGAYFRCLDNLITLHQRKIEKLQNIKKSLLGKMFV